MTKPLAPCGSVAAYSRHVKRGEPIDEPCRRANSEYRGHVHTTTPDLPDLPDALCRQVGPDVWFPFGNPAEQAATARTASAICARCPERTACLEYALGFPTELEGVWAGTTKAQRREMRKAAA